MQHVARTSTLPRFIAILRTGWLLVIVAGIAWLAFEQQPSKREHASPAFSSPLPPFIFVNESSVTLVTSTSTLRVSREAFERRFALAGSKRPIDGVNAAHGSLVFYRQDIRSPDHRMIARLGAPKSDGASVLLFEHTSPNAKSASRVLRLGSVPLRDARVHGWADAKTVFVTALRDATRAIFAVETTGAIRELAPLPDSAISIEARRGGLWVVTAQEGEGIESEPLPPSELHRVTLAGAETVYRDDTQLILAAIPGPRGEIALFTDDGQAELFFPARAEPRKAPLPLGKRRPLLFFEDGRLLLRDGATIFVFDPATGNATRLGELPEGNVEVYSLSPAA